MGGEGPPTPPRARRARGATRAAESPRQPSCQLTVSLLECLQRERTARAKVLPAAEGQAKRLQGPQRVPEPREFARRFDKKKQGLGIPLSSWLPEEEGTGLGIPGFSWLPEEEGAHGVIRCPSPTPAGCFLSAFWARAYIGSQHVVLGWTQAPTSLVVNDFVRRGGDEVGAVVPPRRRSGVTPPPQAASWFTWLDASSGL